MMSKVELKIHLKPELAEQVITTHKQFNSAGRKVSRNEVIEQLIEDGFRLWRRETQAVSKVEATMAQLLDHAERQDKVLKSILLTMADGDENEVAALMQTIEEKHHA